VTICEICGKPFERHFGRGNLTEGGTAFKCPECAAKGLDVTVKPKDEARRDAEAFALELKRLAPLPPVVTYSIMAICAAVFALEIAKGAGFDSMRTDLAIRLGADYGPLTITGQWWRLLTSMFLHFGIFHLGMNMLCLWSLGTLAERLMGRAAFALLYFATGFAGGLLSLAIHPQIVSAGASGAVFGVAGGLVTYLLLKKAPFDTERIKKQLRSLATFLGINLIYSFRPGVDMMAHAGGVAAGLVIGLVLPPFLQAGDAQLVANPIKQETARNSRIIQIGIGCAVLLLVGAFGVRNLKGDDVYLIGSLSQIDEGHSASVIPDLERIVKRKPDSGLAHFALGAAYARTDRGADGLRELKAADNFEPGNPTFELHLGLAYLDQGFVDNAEAILHESVTNNPSNPFAHLSLARVLLLKNENTEAAKEARKVVDAVPNDAMAHDVLGEAEVRLGKDDDGLHEIETAVQLAPDDSELRMRLIGAYTTTGHEDKAVAMKAAMDGQNKSRSAAPSAPPK
jgi:rhomboid protease GluP